MLELSIMENARGSQLEMIKRILKSIVTLAEENHNSGMDSITMAKLSSPFFLLELSLSGGD